VATKKLAIGFIIIFVLALPVLYFGYFNDHHLFGGYGKQIDGLIARNVAAKGGEQAWRSISSLQLSGMMDLGQGLSVPYSIDQKRPQKMCLEYKFNDRRVVQCVDGESGWQFLPFLGSNLPEQMTAEEARKMADTASIDGLLLNAYERGFEVEWLGKEDVNGRTANKLKVTMPGGTVRWIYLDEETGLETKLEYNRIIRGKERLVETVYSNWRTEGGLLFPGRQETRTIGDAESQFVTVDKVIINPGIEDGRFEMPTYGKPEA
jgi:hypothetical protein